jgi:pentalenene oxygenase
MGSPQPGTAGGAWPLLGHGPALYRRPLSFLESLPAHGRLVAIRMGPTRVYVVCDPELTDRMLREDRVYDKGGPLFDKARESMGNGLVTCPHADHRRQRRLCQPAFHPARLAGYTRVMDEQIGRLADGWRPGEPVDLMAALYGLTGRIAVQTMFGADLPQSVQEQSLDDLGTIVAGTYVRMLAPGWVNRLPTPGNRRYDRARIRLRASIGRIAADRRTRESAAADLLCALLAARDEVPEATPGGPTGPTASSAPPPAGLTDAEVVDQVLTFFMAGTETTASVLGWAFHLVAGHPEVQERLHAELDGVLGGRAPTVEDVPNLPYTGRVVTETLRLYPPGWFFTRSTAVDCELAGVRLAAGTTVAYSPYLIHRLPGLYPDPHRFDPDRWDRTDRADGAAVPEAAAGPDVSPALPDGSSARLETAATGPDGTSVHPERSSVRPAGSATRPAVPGSFIPFAAGRRKCIGEDFAFTEAVLALAAVSARWRLRPAPGTRVRPSVGATMAPRDLHMVPTPR